MRGIGFGIAARLSLLGAAALVNMSPAIESIRNNINVTSKRNRRGGHRSVSYQPRWNGGKSYPAGLNGPRAVARRLRQIEAGQLRLENGLAS